MFNSVQPHRQQPTRLPRPWDSPGKNTSGLAFPFQCMKVKRESEVTWSCLTLSVPMDCSLPGSSVHGIFRQEYWSGMLFIYHYLGISENHRESQHREWKGPCALEPGQVNTHTMCFHQKLSRVFLRNKDDTH